MDPTNSGLAAEHRSRLDRAREAASRARSAPAAAYATALGYHDTPARAVRWEPRVDGYSSSGWTSVAVGYADEEPIVPRLETTPLWPAPQPARRAQRYDEPLRVSDADTTVSRIGSVAEARSDPNGIAATPLLRAIERGE